MLLKIYNSPILNSWLSQAITMIFALVAVPIVLTKLSAEEINVWFLLSTVVAIGQGVQFGFNTTFVRYLSYSYSGIKIEEFRNLKLKFNVHHSERIDSDEFSNLLGVLKKVYLILSVIYLGLMVTLGSWAMNKPISLLHHGLEGWITWGLVVVSSTASLYYSVYQIYLIGVSEVALVQRANTFISVVGLVIFLGVSYNSPTLFNIVGVYQAISVLNFICLIYMAGKVKNSLLKKLPATVYSKDVFLIIWESAWKSGVTTIIANIVRQISGIIVAQFFAPAESASFLLTKRLFEILDNFTMTTFQAKIPEIASLRGRGDFAKLMPLLRKVILLTYSVFLAGFAVIAFLGQDLLTLIKGNVQIGSVSLVILFSFAHFISRWTGLNLAISNQSNNIIEHINAIIVFIVYFTFIFLFYGRLGLLVFPAAIIVSVCATIPLILKNTYCTINTTFLKFERTLLIPAFFSLMIINAIYYWRFS